MLEYKKNICFVYSEDVMKKQTCYFFPRPGFLIEIKGEGLKAVVSADPRPNLKKV